MSSIAWSDWVDVSSCDSRLPWLVFDGMDRLGRRVKLCMCVLEYGQTMSLCVCVWGGGGGLRACL